MASNDRSRLQLGMNPSGKVLSESKHYLRHQAGNNQSMQKGHGTR